LEGLETEDKSLLRASRSSFPHKREASPNTRHKRSKLFNQQAQRIYPGYSSAPNPDPIKIVQDTQDAHPSSNPARQDKTEKKKETTKPVKTHRLRNETTRPLTLH
jgi:hypothetical protein